jgi:hypothetical protein
MSSCTTNGPTVRKIDTRATRTSSWSKRIPPNRRLNTGAALGRTDETDCSGTLTVDGRPARLVFDGVRKVVKVLHAPGGHQPSAGDEISYSEFEIADADLLRRYASGDAVPLVSIV